MGTGKSTLAAAISAATGAVVLDHDTTKTAILRAGVPHPPAGFASYEVLFAVAADLVAQQHSVVIDSPCLYESIARDGLEIASAHGIRYYFVECECPEADATHRLQSRVGRVSQVADVTAAKEVRQSLGRTPHRPATGTLVIETTQPVNDCLGLVLAYLASDGAAGPVLSDK
jgi:predicted kinase